MESGEGLTPEQEREHAKLVDEQYMEDLGMVGASRNAAAYRLHEDSARERGDIEQADKYAAEAESFEEISRQTPNLDRSREFVDENYDALVETARKEAEADGKQVNL